MTTGDQTRRYPALRCQMGSWVYYVTAMPMSDIAERVGRYSEERYPENLDYVMQRALEPRINQIANYLIRSEDRFFNAIVVGVIGGPPKWWSVGLADSTPLDVPRLDARDEGVLGILELVGSERMFAIDGQHRVQAINRATNAYPELGDEEMAVIFVAHRDNAGGIEKTRRLFVTLNKYAKAPGRGYTIAMDEDDAFAITTRRVMGEYDGLNRVFHEGKTAKALVQFQTGPELQTSNGYSITSIVTLYDITVNVSVPAGAKKSDLQRFRPSPEVIDGFYEKQVRFWDAVREGVPELDTVMRSDPADELTRKSGFRDEDGGHTLFRPAGQKAFSRAVQIMVTRGMSIESAVRKLTKSPMDLNGFPWAGTLWNPVAKKMMSSGFRLHTNLFLYLAEQPVDSEKYDLLEQYRRVLNDEAAELPTPFLVPSDA